MNNQIMENMVMNRILMFLALALSTAVYAATDVSAHVLIRDESKTVGAVLHITPGDDPVAGESSTISLSINNASLRSSDSLLFVKNTTTGTTDALKYSQNNGALTAEYVFPSQGTYDLTIEARASDTKKYNFTYTQRVSKGLGTNTDATTYPLARFGLFATSIVFLLTVFVVLKKKKDMASQSSF